MLDHLDFWVAMFTLAALAYYTLPASWRRALVGGLKWGVGLFVTWHHEEQPARRSARPSLVTGRSWKRSRRVPFSRQRSPRVNAGEARSPRPDAEHASVQRSPFTVHRSPPDEVQPPTVAELQQLAEAIRLIASGEERTKQGAVERAFGVTKGKGRGWARASQLYDLALAGKARGPAKEVETA